MPRLPRIALVGLGLAVMGSPLVPSCVALQLRDPVSVTYSWSQDLVSVPSNWPPEAAFPPYGDIFGTFTFRLPTADLEPGDPSIGRYVVPRGVTGWVKAEFGDWSKEWQFTNARLEATIDTSYEAFGLSITGEDLSFGMFFLPSGVPPEPEFAHFFVNDSPEFLAKLDLHYGGTGWLREAGADYWDEAYGDRGLEMSDAIVAPCPIPDGGSTAWLLGLATSGLLVGGWSRRAGRR